MRRLGTIMAVLLALVSAVAAAGMITIYLKEQAKAAHEGPELVPVVISSADLSFGRTLEEADLQIAMFPKESIPKGAVSVKDSLIGKTTKVFLAEHEPILVTKLSDIGGGLSLLIEPSKRAASIQVDKVSGVSGFVLPGDRVDVIAVVRSVSASRDARAKTILQNIEVLAAGQKIEQRGTDPIPVQSVTLLVDLAEAEALALAANEGKIHLTLRNPNDIEISAETGGITRTKMMAAPKKKTTPRRRATTRPKKTPPPKPDSLTIFRGTKAEKNTPAMEVPKLPKDS